MKLILAAPLLAMTTAALAQEAPEPPTPASVIAAAPAADWRAIDAADLLVMNLAPDAAGNERRVVIQLMPPPFSQGWVENVRALAKARWWDGTSVYRVVDNWVAQWGDVDEAKPLPEGLREVPESEYMAPYTPNMFSEIWTRFGKQRAVTQVAAPRPDVLGGPDFSDPYSDAVSYVAGVPVALRTANRRTVPITSEPERVWPVHCYGSVGVARSTDTTGTGSELYAVIGHAPRQLDRNIAVVGRVIEGIEHLSTLPRGKGEAGVYDDAALRVPIVSVRLGNEVQEFPPPRFEYLASESESFARYARVRANRRDDFYKVPAGGVDVCNVQVPIRRVPSD